MGARRKASGLLFIVGVVLILVSFADTALLTVEPVIETIRMGGVFVQVGQSHTFTATVNEAGTIAEQLYPPSGTSTYSGAVITGTWNVHLGQVIIEENLPFTVTFSVKCESSPGSGFWVYPRFGYELPVEEEPPPPIEMHSVSLSVSPLVVDFGDSATLTVVLKRNGVALAGETVSVYYRNPSDSGWSPLVDVGSTGLDGVAVCNQGVDSSWFRGESCSLKAIYGNVESNVATLILEDSTIPPSDGDGDVPPSDGDGDGDGGDGGVAPDLMPFTALGLQLAGVCCIALAVGLYVSEGKVKRRR
jgi:hypothetical protein